MTVGESPARVGGVERVTGRQQYVADIPLAPLADEAPLYDRPHVPTPKPADLSDEPESSDIAADLVKLMGSPDIASRHSPARRCVRSTPSTVIRPSVGS